jgi:hypothetical protein
MSETLSAVVAGSKGFVDAVQGHLKIRFGAPPQVARDPAEALRACADGGGLLVLEYAGSPWLEAVKNLRGACGDAALSIVAAVPLAQAADVRPLQRAGVDEVVSWAGRVDPVIWAVDRIVGRQSARPVGPLPVDEAVVPPKPQVVPDTELREITTTDAPVGSTAAPVPVLPVAQRAPNIPPLPVPAVTWPGGVPSAAVAEAVLLAQSAGRAAGDPAQHEAATRVMAGASELERAAFAGRDVQVDPAALRAAVSMRLRLEIALSTMPAAGGAVDQQAAQQLLAEVDGLLEQVKALGGSAATGVAPTLEPTRLALVDGGVKLAGALSGLVPADAVPLARPVPSARAPSTRVLSNEREEGRQRQPRTLALAFVLALVLGVGVAYHAWTRIAHPVVRPRTVANAPGNTIGMVRGAGKVVTALAGRPIDPAELERFKAAERVNGNVVKEVRPGTWMVIPEAEARAQERGGRP